MKWKKMKKYDDKVFFVMATGDKEEMRALADEMDLSMGQFIRQAIKVKVKEEKARLEKEAIEE